MIILKMVGVLNTSKLRSLRTADPDLVTKVLVKHAFRNWALRTHGAREVSFGKRCHIQAGAKI